MTSRALEDRYRIRDAQCTDGPAIRQLVQEVLAEHGLPFQLTGYDRDLQDVQASYVAWGGRFVVVEERDGIAGCGGVFPLASGQAEIRKMYLRPDARGRGIGSRMLAALIEHARTRGVERFLLFTSDKLPRAAALYRAHGFHDAPLPERSERCDGAMELVVSGASSEVTRAVRIGVVADYDDDFVPLPATNVALAGAAVALGMSVRVTWFPTAELHASQVDIATCHGLIIGPGSPLRNVNGRAYENHAAVLEVIRFARERGVPTLATCAGFQHVALEYLRHVAGVSNGTASYYEEDGPQVIVPLACSLRGLRLPVLLTTGSRARRAYDDEDVVNEEYYCRFGVAPEFQRRCTEAGLLITGVDGNDGDARIIELPSHPFFVGACFVPQVRSTREHPHPLITAFLEAAQQLVPQP